MSDRATTPGAVPAGDGDTRYGQVFDRGYSHYDGPREGRRRAVISLFGYSIKRALGIRKSWTAKILPALLYFSAFIPIIVMIGISTLIPDAEIASYAGYFGAISLLEVIFVATVVPEILIPDRRERTLPLYFARAITRFDYVFAKMAAAAVLTMTLSVIPVILLWLGRQLTANSPVSAMRDNLDDLGKAILMGTIIALTLGTISLVISSMSNRKGVAIAVIVIGLLVFSGLTEVAMTELNENWRRFLIFASVEHVYNAMASSLFDSNPDDYVQIADFDVWVYYAWSAVIVIGGSLFVRWRYSPRNAS